MNRRLLQAFFSAGLAGVQGAAKRGAGGGRVAADRARVFLLCFEWVGRGGWGRHEGRASRGEAVKKLLTGVDLVVSNF